eukprot:Skav230154  [mRNA]  locus=scaffold1301:561771:563997:- [translate_table: standard]
MACPAWRAPRSVARLEDLLPSSATTRRTELVTGACRTCRGGYAVSGSCSQELIIANSKAHKDGVFAVVVEVLRREHPGNWSPPAAYVRRPFARTLQRVKEELKGSGAARAVGAAGP